MINDGPYTQEQKQDEIIFSTNVTPTEQVGDVIPSPTQEEVDVITLPPIGHFQNLKLTEYSGESGESEESEEKSEDVENTEDKKSFAELIEAAESITINDLTVAEERKKNDNAEAEERKNDNVKDEEKIIEPPRILEENSEKVAAPPKQQKATKTSQKTAEEFAKSKRASKPTEFREANAKAMENWQEGVEKEPSSKEVKMKPQVWTSQETAEAFDESRNLEKNTFLDINRQTMQEWRQSSFRPIHAQVPPKELFEGFRKNPKQFDEMDEKLFKELSALNLVEPRVPQEPEKPIVEKSAPSSRWAALWGASKTSAELEYDDKKRVYDSEMQKYKAAKVAFDDRHQAAQDLTSTLNSLQRNLEKLAVFEPSLSEETIQKELRLSDARHEKTGGFRDKENGAASHILGNKWERNNLVREIKDNRDCAIEAEKAFKLQRHMSARVPVSSDEVEYEMQDAYARREVNRFKNK